MKDERIRGVVTGMGLGIEADSVVLTNDTLLNGIIHIAFPHQALCHPERSPKGGGSINIKIFPQILRYAQDDKRFGLRTRAWPDKP